MRGRIEGAFIRMSEVGDSWSSSPIVMADSRVSCLVTLQDMVSPLYLGLRGDAIPVRCVQELTFLR